MIRYLTDEGLELLEGNEYMEPVIRTQAAAEIRALRQENERLTQIVKGVEGLCIAGPAMINAARKLGTLADAAPVAQSLIQRLAQAQAQVLHGVMIIHGQVAAGAQAQVHQCMP